MGSPEETRQGDRGTQWEVTGQGRPLAEIGAARRKLCRAQKEAKVRTEGKESWWLLEALVRKIILQTHTPAQCWSWHTRHGLGVCISMHLVNGTGNSPSPGQPTPEESTGQVIRGLC